MDDERLASSMSKYVDRCVMQMVSCKRLWWKSREDNFRRQPVGERHRLYTDGKVILSGGAINSPQLLMLSGIGPAKELKVVLMQWRVKRMIILFAVTRHRCA